MICGSYINVHRLPSNNYMPCRIKFFVKLLFDKCRNVLQTILGFEGNITLSNQAKPMKGKLFSTYIRVFVLMKIQQAYLFDTILMTRSGKVCEKDKSVTVSTQ